MKNILKIFIMCAPMNDKKEAEIKRRMRDDLRSFEEHKLKGASTLEDVERLRDDLNEYIKSTSSNSDNEAPKPFLVKLMDGDFGLKKTFWLYGVVALYLGNVFVNLIANHTPPFVGTPLLLLKLAFNVLVLIGIWGASNRYEGPKRWALLAKIFVIAMVILSILIITAWHTFLYYFLD